MEDSQPQTDSQTIAADVPLDTQEIENATPPSNIFLPPSLHHDLLLSGESYSHYTPIPPTLVSSPETPVCIGIDEAGRGPVLGGMVYALLYLPLTQHRKLLAETYHFDDSKVLTPAVRSNLMQLLCTPGHPLHEACGWATKVLSARDISSGMLKPNGPYNLNAQAMDATVELIKGVIALGINVKEIYIDTIGPPESYQRKLERIFPTVVITVAKKADSLYPCVSAASVCAKVTRDAGLEVCYEGISQGLISPESNEGWGSGYPSDARCTGWLKRNFDPVFGWGNECRFSWGTVKDMLDGKGDGVNVDWPEDDDDDEDLKVTKFFSATSTGTTGPDADLRNWFGTSAGTEVF